MDKPVRAPEIRSLTESYCLTLDEENRRIRCSGHKLEGKTISREIVECLLYSMYEAGRSGMFDAREYRIVSREKPDS